MSGRVCGAVVLAVAALAAGCGSDDSAVTTPPTPTVPDRPPSPTQLATIRSTPGAPIYWLGGRYGSQRLTRATLTAADPPDSIFQYGKPACDAAAGCSYPLGVATVRKRAPASEEACWHTLGAALALACAGSETLQVYTGSVEVFIRSVGDDPLRVARVLRLKTAAAGRTGVATLPPPRPLACDQVKRFPDAFKAALPAALRPDCG